MTVKIEVWSITGEIGETFGRQMMLVRWVGIRGDVRKVRCIELYHSAVFGDPMKLGDDREHVFNVFDHLITDYNVKLVVGKRVRHAIQVMNNIGARPGIAIQSNGTRGLVLSAPDVQYSHLQTR